MPGSLFAVTADSHTITDCIMVIHAKTDSTMDQSDSEKLSHGSGLTLAYLLMQIYRGLALSGGTERKDGGVSINLDCNARFVFSLFF